MRTFQSCSLRFLSFCLLLCLLATTVLATSPMIDGPITDSDEAVLLPDPLTMSRISTGFMVNYQKYYRENPCGIAPHGINGYPDYFAGFYKNDDGTMVMCLTEITEEILAEIKAVIYAPYDPVEEAGSIAFLDKWFPTMTYQKVTYSGAQIYGLTFELKDALYEAHHGDYHGQYQVKCDVNANQVAVFCESEEDLALAESFIDEETYPGMLLVLPTEKYDAWNVSYTDRNVFRLPEESAAQSAPEEPGSATRLRPMHPKHNLRDRPY